MGELTLYINTNRQQYVALTSRPRQRIYFYSVLVMRTEATFGFLGNHNSATEDGQAILFIRILGLWIRHCSFLGLVKGFN